MAISGILSTAVSGLAYASSKVAVAADNVANLNTDGYRAKDVRSSTLVTRQTSETSYTPGGVTNLVRDQGTPQFENGSNVDLATEFVKIIEATVAYKAGVAVIRTGDELSRELIDIKA